MKKRKRVTYLIKHTSLFCPFTVSRCVAGHLFMLHAKSLKGDFNILRTVIYFMIDLAFVMKLDLLIGKRLSVRPFSQPCSRTFAWIPPSGWLQGILQSC